MTLDTCDTPNLEKSEAHAFPIGFGFPLVLKFETSSTEDAETFGIAGGVDPRQRQPLAPGQSNLVIDSAVVPAACTQRLD